MSGSSRRVRADGSAVLQPGRVAFIQPGRLAGVLPPVPTTRRIPHRPAQRTPVYDIVYSCQTIGTIPTRVNRLHVRRLTTCQDRGIRSPSAWSRRRHPAWALMCLCGSEEAPHSVRRQRGTRAASPRSMIGRRGRCWTCAVVISCA